MVDGEIGSAAAVLAGVLVAKDDVVAVQIYFTVASLGNGHKESHLEFPIDSGHMTS